MHRTIPAILTAATLTACGGETLTITGGTAVGGSTIDAPAARNSGSTSRIGGVDFYSGYASPLSDGTLRAAAANYLEASDTSAQTGNAYVYGVQTGSNFAATTGITTTSSVTSPPTSGTATYTGTFGVGGFDTLDVVASGDATPFFDTGTLTLTANFGGGAVTGFGTSEASATSTPGRTLTITGVVSGGLLTGDTTYDGEAGDLYGLIGTEEAIGTFHGKGFSITYAGGFIAN